jgi:hypothetical protein
VEDLHAILGVPPGATAEELTAAFRALAKQAHPDTAGDTPGATARMAEINAAYEHLRGRGPASPNGPVNGHAPPAASWVADRTRRALGRELLEALDRRETVELVTPASTWASPQTLLAVTDRRLLWLHDDAVLARVRTVRFRDVVAADVRLSWPRRQRATVRLRGWDGRRHAFSGLRPAVAQHIAQAVAAGGAG